MVDAVVAGGDAVPAVYGVNTGFGALAEVRISADQVTRLQQNLVRSHATGIGSPRPREALRGRALIDDGSLFAAAAHAGVHP